MVLTSRSKVLEFEYRLLIVYIQQNPSLCCTSDLNSALTLGAITWLALPTSLSSIQSSTYHQYLIVGIFDTYIRLTLEPAVITPSRYVGCIGIRHISIECKGLTGFLAHLVIHCRAGAITIFNPICDKRSKIVAYVVYITNEAGFVALSSNDSPGIEIGTVVRDAEDLGRQWCDIIYIVNCWGDRWWRWR